MSLTGYQNYYEKDAETWERQALIRARPVAGDIELGQEFVKQAHAFAYSQALTAEQIAYIVHNRQRKEAQADASSFYFTPSKRQEKTADRCEIWIRGTHRYRISCPNTPANPRYDTLASAGAEHS